jgi:uncharacterized DUF497 family protein
VRIEFDAAKNEANIAKHGVDLRSAEDFDFDTAVYAEDDRKHYGETRYIALGRLSGRLHVMVFTLRDESIRVISLRKANKREEKLYNEKT